jgi:hypothetical protein
MQVSQSFDASASRYEISIVVLGNNTEPENSQVAIAILPVVAWWESGDQAGKPPQQRGKTTATIVQPNEKSTASF